jgi:hypothetical protein
MSHTVELSDRAPMRSFQRWRGGVDNHWRSYLKHWRHNEWQSAIP